MSRSSAWFVAALASAVFATPRLACAQAGAEPSWPQKFEIRQGENRGFAFVVTQPGAITVTVESKSGPVVVSLSGPVAQPISQTGSGTFKITHNETAAEVQHSAIWLITLSPVNGGKAAAMKASPIVAQGTISVQHPPGDVHVAQAEAQRRFVARPVAAPTMTVSMVSPKQAEYMKQLTAKQAGEKQALMGRIHQTPPMAMSAPRPVPTTATMSANAQATKKSGSHGNQSSGGSSSAPATPPHIDSLSVARGQPGDPVLVYGSGFGAAQGQSKVHLIVAPGKDVTAARFDFWSDNQILMYVPFVDSTLAFNGELYFANTSAKSNLTSFHYDPLLQYVVLDLKKENVVQAAGGFVHVQGPNTCRYTDTGPYEPGQCVDHSVSPNTAFNWTNNDDEFFPYMKLKNSWVTDSVDFRGTPASAGGAFLAEQRQGTDSPYAKVHWWLNPFGEIWYTLTITIRGPSGVPYQ